MYPETCVFTTYDGWGAANPVYPLGPSNGDDQTNYGPMPPSCPADPILVWSIQSPQFTWCEGQPLSANATYQTRVQNALSRIRARGGNCVALADLGTELVNNDRVRTFPHAWAANRSFGYAGMVGGALPENGGSLGDNAYITISDRLPRFAWDGDHRDAETQATLDQILAHELSHLLGDTHINETNVMLYRTPMQVACTD